MESLVENLRYTPQSPKFTPSFPFYGQFHFTVVYVSLKPSFGLHFRAQRIFDNIRYI
jgi:hypothetical protein